MKDFAAIDFETANGKRTSVCSVGIVIVKGGRIVNKIYRLIRPAPNYYTQWTTAIHGLTYDDTMEADDFPEVWAEIKPLLEGLPLVVILYFKPPYSQYISPSSILLNSF